MIKRLRLKFIVINMGIATILLSAMLGLVFYFTSANLETESIRMMERIASQPFQMDAPGELGEDVLEEYTVRAGLTSSYRVSGLNTAAGSFDFDGLTANELGWAGVGQYNDLANPCALMVYMGAIANGGTAAVPRLVLKTENALGLPSLPALPRHTQKLVEGDTAAALAELMAHNVTAQYGASRFPNMDVCAKSGTAEVGGGKAPHAWFAGFLRNPDAPYAFVVLVENGGSGADAAGSVAARVLDAVVNGY